MTPAAIVTLLRDHGAELYVDTTTGKLRCRAPADCLLSLEFKKLLAEMVFQYEERRAIHRHREGVADAEAQRLAAADILGSPAAAMPATAATLTADGPAQGIGTDAQHGDQAQRNCGAQE